jgi:hypothetical protein
MLTKEVIESKNFKHYKSIEEYQISGNTTIVIDTYVGLAVIEKEGTDNIEFPIKLVYYTVDGELSIQTYYNNPKIFNEFFYTSVITTEPGLDEALTKVKFTIGSIDLDKLNTYA